MNWIWRDSVSTYVSVTDMVFNSNAIGLSLVHICSHANLLYVLISYHWVHTCGVWCDVQNTIESFACNIYTGFAVWSGYPLINTNYLYLSPARQWRVECVWPYTSTHEHGHTAIPAEAPFGGQQHGREKRGRECVRHQETKNASKTSLITFCAILLFWVKQTNPACMLPGPPVQLLSLISIIQVNL